MGEPRTGGVARWESDFFKAKTEEMFLYFRRLSVFGTLFHKGGTGERSGFVYFKVEKLLRWRTGSKTELTVGSAVNTDWRSRFTGLSG